MLLGEALHRNPRSAKGLVLSFRHYLVINDLRNALGQLAAINRLNGQIVDMLLTDYGKAIANARQIDEMTAAMAAHDDLYLPFVHGFALANRSPELTSHLIDRLPAAILDRPEIRGMAIDQLVRVGAFARARGLWNVENAARGDALVYSPDFSDGKALPPFNWRLEENSTGV